MVNTTSRVNAIYIHSTIKKLTDIFSIEVNCLDELETCFSVSINFDTGLYKVPASDDTNGLSTNKK